MPKKMPAPKSIPSTTTKVAPQVTPVEPPQAERVDAPKKEAKPTKTKEQRDAEELAKQTALGLTGDQVISTAAMHAVKHKIASSLVPEKHGILVGLADWTIEHSLDTLRLMGNLGINRSVTESQVTKLATSMRAAQGYVADPNGAKPLPWYQGTNCAVISKNAEGFDSRHRTLAFIYAFGTREDWDMALRITYRHKQFDRDSKGYYPVPPADLIAAYDSQWRFNGDGEGEKKLVITVPDNWTLAVQIGCESDAMAAIDSALLLKSKWHMLETGQESSKVLTALRLLDREDDVVTPLRQIYLRAYGKFVDDKDNPESKEKIWKYGSARTGGADPEERYRVYSHLILGHVDSSGKVIPGYLANAITILDATIKDGLVRQAKSKDGYTYLAANIDILKRYHILTILALALQAGASEKDCTDFIDSLCVPTKNDSPLNAARWLRLYCDKKSVYRHGKTVEKTGCFLRDDGTDQTLGGYSVLCALSRAFMDEHTEFDTLSDFINGRLNSTKDAYIIDSAIDEQAARNRIRLVGADDELLDSWDSTGIPHELVQAAELAVQGKASQGRSSKGSAKRTPAPIRKSKG